jgi:hypothetical protein
MANEKEQVKVIIYTDSGRIRGNIYKLSGGRLLDMVNFAQKEFLAVTDFELTDMMTNKILDKGTFVALNRKNIIGVREDI